MLVHESDDAVWSAVGPRNATGTRSYTVGCNHEAKYVYSVARPTTISVRTRYGVRAVNGGFRYVHRSAGSALRSRATVVYSRDLVYWSEGLGSLGRTRACSRLSAAGGPGRAVEPRQEVSDLRGRLCDGALYGKGALDGTP